MWKKAVPRTKSDRSLHNNSRLNSRFEETLLSKESFGSLFTDANESIRTIVMCYDLSLNNMKVVPAIARRGTQAAPYYPPNFAI